MSLIRNGACVLKSLLPQEHALMQPLMSFPQALLPFGGGNDNGTAWELERFTTLEGFIGVMQLAGACFNLVKGAKVLACCEAF